MDMQKKATPQQAARSAMLLSLIMKGRGLTDEELTAIDTLYAEWPQELKDKTAPFSELVRIEDEKASAHSPEK